MFVGKLPVQHMKNVLKLDTRNADLTSMWLGFYVKSFNIFHRCYEHLSVETIYLAGKVKIISMFFSAVLDSSA